MSHDQQLFHWFKTYFGSEPTAQDDQAWNDWYQLSHPGLAEYPFVNLMNSDARDTIKARAAVFLLAPHTSFIPLAWRPGTKTTDSSQTYRLPCQRFWLFMGNMSSSLLRFCGELMVSALQMCHQNSKHMVGSRDILQSLIVKWLAVLPVDDLLAERLFNALQVVDKGETYADPIVSLASTMIRHEILDRSWKKRLLKQMRDQSELFLDRAHELTTDDISRHVNQMSHVITEICTFAENIQCDDYAPLLRYVIEIGEKTGVWRPNIRAITMLYDHFDNGDETLNVLLDATVLDGQRVRTAAELGPISSTDVEVVHHLIHRHYFLNQHVCLVLNELLDDLRTRQETEIAERQKYQKELGRVCNNLR